MNRKPPKEDILRTRRPERHAAPSSGIVMLTILTLWPLLSTSVHALTVAIDDTQVTYSNLIDQDQDLRFTGSGPGNTFSMHYTILFVGPNKTGQWFDRIYAAPTGTSTYTLITNSAVYATGESDSSLVREVAVPTDQFDSGVYDLRIEIWRVGEGSFTDRSFPIGTLNNRSLETPLQDGLVTPPSVVLNHPTDRTSFRAGTPLTLAASASDVDGTVTRVEFFANQMLLGSDDSPPFTLQWANPTASNEPYELRAHALDNHGSRGISEPVAITIQSLNPTINLIEPSDGAIISRPTNLTIRVIAFDLDGFDDLVDQVHFYTNGMLLGASSAITSNAVSWTWNDPPVGQHQISAVAIDAVGLTNETATRIVTVNHPAGATPVFSFSQATYPVHEDAGAIELRVLKNDSPAGSVIYLTRSGTARAAVGSNPGDFREAAGILSFDSGPGSRTISVTIEDDRGHEGDQDFTVELQQPQGSGVLLTNPTVARVVILENDPPPPTGSDSLVVPPGGFPILGSLKVDLNVTNQGVPQALPLGQWRLLWDPVWRFSGHTLEHLEPGMYEIEFRPLDGAQPPQRLAVMVGAGLTTTNAAHNAPDGLRTGRLRVSLTPTSAQWRIQGEDTWRTGEGEVEFPAGSCVLEYNDHAGHFRLPPEVVSLRANRTTQLHRTLPGDTTIPSLASVAFNRLGNDGISAGEPHPFQGQVLSDSAGSGFAVKPRVVLTAAHIVFDGHRFAFRTNAWWFHRRYAGAFEPRPSKARGWYVLGGYDARRLLDGGATVSSPAAQALDVAAMFFLDEATSGARGGYLASDEQNAWLEGGDDKLLVGYPLDHPAQFGENRKLHASTRSTVALAPIASGKVYTSQSFRSSGGHSGGPLCVEHNSQFYPAAIYLGGTGQSVFRVIDGEVVELINRADLTSNTGDNNNAGGIPVAAVGPATTLPVDFGKTGDLRVELVNDSGPLANAGWGFFVTNGTPFYINDPQLILNRPVGLQFNRLTFLDVPGYLTPGDILAPIVDGATSVVQVVYRRPDAFRMEQLSVSNGLSFDITGSSGGTICVQGSRDFTNWFDLTNSFLDVAGQRRVELLDLVHSNRLYLRVKYGP